MTIEQLNRKIARIDVKVRTLVGQSIKRHSKEIVKRNQAQLSEGVDANDKKLGSYKSESWVKKREKRGLQTTYVDLNFTGDWQKSMYVKFDNVGVSFGVDATKKHEWNGEDVLVHHWGEDIYGLNEENFEWLLDKITDDLFMGLKTYFA